MSLGGEGTTSRAADIRALDSDSELPSCLKVMEIPVATQDAAVGTLVDGNIIMCGGKTLE